MQEQQCPELQHLADLLVSRQHEAAPADLFCLSLALFQSWCVLSVYVSVNACVCLCKQVCATFLFLQLKHALYPAGCTVSINIVLLRAETVVREDKGHWWTQAKSPSVMSRACNWWNPTPPAGRSCVGVNTGPFASVQVKAHSRNHRLEVRPRGAGSAVVLETSLREAAELWFSVSHTAVELTLQQSD